MDKKNNIKLLQNKELKLFLVNSIVSLIYYSITLSARHYSADFFSTYFQSSANQHLKLGRIFHYVIYKLLECLGIKIEHHIIFNQVFLIIIMAMLTTLLWKLFSELIHIDNQRDAVILDAVIWLNFFNISILEGWFLFSETCFGAAISLTISYCAIITFCKSDDWRGYLKAFLFLVVALGMYQVYIEIFLIITAVYVLIKNQCILTKKTLYDFLKIILIGGMASIVSILITKLLEILNISSGDGRTVVIDGNIILRNGIEIVKNFRGVVDNYGGYLPKHSLLCYVCIMLALLGMSWYREKKFITRCIALVIFFIASVIAAYLPHFIVSTLWMAPRTILGISALLFSISIITFTYIKHKNIEKIIFSAFLMLFLFVNFIQIQRIVVNGSVLVGIEEENVHQLGEKIREYEQSTGNEIKYISYANDTCYKWTFDPVEYNIYNTNSRRANVEWAFVNMINFYSGRNFKEKELKKDKFEELFGNKNWNYINLDEQIYFEDDTVYVAVY